MESTNRLIDVYITINAPTDRGKLSQIIIMLQGLMGMKFSEKADPIAQDPAILEFLSFSYTADFGKSLKTI